MNDPSGGAGSGGLAVLGAIVRQHTRRASGSDTGGYLPDVNAARRRTRGAGGGVVAVEMPPVETAVASGVHLPSEGKSPLFSARTDPG